MRPKYERESDREKEENVVQLFSKKWSVDLVRTKKLSAVDYLMTRNSVLLGLVEIKCREIPKEMYPSVMIPNHKAQKMIYAGKALKAKPIYIVQWTNKTGWVDLSKAKGCKVRKGGRKDRGDPADIEDIFYIPVQNFTEVLWVE